MLLKSGINRVGGKAYLSQWLCSFLPEHTLYCEPFAGGAKLFFSKEPSQVEILNDIDNNLVNLYKVIQNNQKREELIETLNEIPYSRSVFNHFRKSEPQDEIEKAVRYFYLSKASFAGDVSYGGFGTPSRSTTRNPSMTYQNSINALEHIAKRLKLVTIECLDFRDCISKYDSDSSLFFVDAPYLYCRSKRYYGQRFTYEDHLELSNMLHSAKAKVMFCHYENPEINKLYGDWNKYTYRSFKGSHKSTGESKPKTQECLFVNFLPVKTQGLFNGAV